MSDDLAYRLQRAEDLLAIQQLFNEYASYLDAGDFSRYAALFCADGEVKLGPMGRAVGPTAIEALMRKHLAASVGQSYHIISNPVVQLQGDMATAEVMWTVIMRSQNDKPIIGMIGKHRDKLRREHGLWRFQERAGFVDIPAAM